MINFVRKLDWRNKSEGPPQTIVMKSDLLRYENGIGDLADEVNGRLSETELNGTYAPTGKTRPVSLHSIGDSITAASYNISQPGSRWVFDGPRNPWAWAHILSSGRIRLGSISATGGYTSTQIKDEHLPTALTKASAGDFIAVLCGTNDTAITGGIGGTLSKANLLSMYQSIRAAGCYPVLCTIPPRSGETSAAAGLRSKLNAWIAFTAKVNRWHFVDFHRVLVDSATSGAYKSGLNYDQVHPEGPGAKAMGQVICDALVAADLPAPFLADFNNGTGVNPDDGALLFGNACMVTDTNADGAPDQFTSLSGTLTGGSARTLTTVAGVEGKLFTVARGATGPDDVIASTTAVAAIAGHRYYAAWKMQANLVGADSTVVAEVKGGDGQSIAGLAMPGWGPGSLGTRPMTIPLSVFAVEFVMPTVAPSTLWFSVRARVSECSIGVGQFTLIDLTALGL